LRGDAAQRVIVTQALGWQPAQQISGTSWMPFYLAQALDDPYEAIRFVAYRSLRGLPGFSDIPYDFVAPPRQRLDAAMKTIDRWRSRRTEDTVAAAALLFNSDGTPRADVVARLLKARDHRRVLLRE